MNQIRRVVLLGLVLSGALARAEIIQNFPDHLLHEHHEWHMSHNAGAAGGGVEFLRFHRDYAARGLAWYRGQPGANLNAVADTWRAVPSELKQSAYGWNATLASAEQRIATNQPAFASEDELGRFIETTLHNWIHMASGTHYGETALHVSERSPTSTYFYKIHGLVDYWWSLYRGRHDVGVLPAASCPSAFATATLHMDNEDDDEQSRVSGWVGPTSVDGNGNTNFTFCRVDGNQFRSLTSGSDARTNYAVLKLGAACPSGSVEFWRYFDNEDSDNRNSTNFHMYPNEVNRNSKLFFCLFKGDGVTASSLPQLGFDYGVFAGTQFGFSSAKGSIYTDDEDDNDNGYSTEWKTLATAIVKEEGANTRMFTAKAGTPICGDWVCNGLEDSSSCLNDCPICGDGVCGGAETAYSCTTDCGYCGDGICSWSEDASVCSMDCGTCGGTTGGVGIPQDQICPAM